MYSRAHVGKLNFVMLAEIFILMLVISPLKETDIYSVGEPCGRYSEYVMIEEQCPELPSFGQHQVAHIFSSGPYHASLTFGTTSDRGAGIARLLSPAR